jgi:DNA replication protein DnaC
MHRAVSVYKLLIIDEIGYLPLARAGQRKGRREHRR